MHSSLILLSRASSPNDLLRHLELCSQVLSLYLNIARQLDRRLSLETWEVFLKVPVFGSDFFFFELMHPPSPIAHWIFFLDDQILIGVSEHLFHASESEFGRKIATQLIKVRFFCLVLVTTTPLTC